MVAPVEHSAAEITLSELVAGFVPASIVEKLTSDVLIKGIQLDSRLVIPGDVFFAVFGRNLDARDFIPTAINSGAVAVLAESGGEWTGINWIGHVPVIAVDSLQSKMSAIAGRFYSDPSAHAGVIGITGTNGKTSCAAFMAQVFASLGHDSATIGTLGYGRPGCLAATALTTPDAVFTQRALFELLSTGVDPVIMEVSSVGLDQRRVSGVHFETAVFTNLTRDHLDYHGTMEAYGSSKKKLFTMPGLKRAVINLDDAYGLSLINAIASSVEVMTYSQSRTAASVRAERVTMDSHGIAMHLITPIGSGEVRIGLLGGFNLSNLLAVVATVVSSFLSAERKPRVVSAEESLSFPRLAAALGELKPVPGRMQIVSAEGEVSDISVVVDYAHTPDGLRSALLGLREHFSGELTCLFGAGGNRDVGKRPLMGEVAERYADTVILTDDNPRTEDGDAIIDQIRSGFIQPEIVTKIRNRAEAIATVIDAAKPGAVILIAGKGHEDYQEINGQRQPVSDLEHARAALVKRRSSSSFRDSIQRDAT